MSDDWQRSVEEELVEQKQDEQEQLAMFGYFATTALMRIYDVLMLDIVLKSPEHKKAAERLKAKHAKGEFEFPMVLPMEPEGD